MDTNDTCDSAKPEVPFVPFLVGLTIWAVLKLTLEGFVRNFFPAFYDDLRLDIRRKYNFYFGTWMGTIFKVVSAITCGAALFTTRAETDIVGLIRPLNVAEQWCWGCRAVIYIQELPDVTSVPELVIHHVLSIAAMVGILAYNLPRRQIYLLWTTLVNEFVGNARRILTIHDCMSPGVSWWTALVNSSLIWIFRISGAFVALIWVLQGGTRGITLFVNIAAMLFYIIYMIKMTSREFSRNKIFNIDPVGGSYLVVAERWKINLIGIFMGLGLACAEISTMLIYDLDGTRITSERGIHSITLVTLQAAATGLIGASLFPRLNKDSEKNLPKLSLHGGFLFAAATILFSPTLADTVDRTAFAACLMLSFPLMDSITRWGRSLATPPTTVAEVLTSEKNGLNLIDPVENTIQTPPDISFGADPSWQRIASYFGFAIYLGTIFAYINGPLSLYRAAGLALALQAAVHLNIDARRDRFFSKHKFLQKSRIWATTFYSTQAGLCVICATYIVYLENDHFGFLSWDSSSLHWIQYHLLFIIALITFSPAIDLLSRQMQRCRKAHFECPSPSGEKGIDVVSTDGKMLTNNPPPKSLVSGWKGVSILCGIGLCLLMAAGDHLGIMPEQFTTVNEAMSSVSLVPQVALWGVASSWQFVLSILGVTALPVLVVQLVD